MRLIRFSGKGVHGHLDFRLRFKRKMNLLTGINGSGKTTALNAIISLITPDLRTLSALSFEHLELEIENNDERYIIFSDRDDDEIRLFTSTSPDALAFRAFIPDVDLPANRQVEAEAGHFSEIMNANANHPVLKFIGDLPTPMFLGLDRRAKYSDSERRSRYWPDVRVIPAAIDQDRWAH